MRPSLRFLAVAVAGWVGLRAATLGVIPGARLFNVQQQPAAVAPVMATQFPPIEPIAPEPAPPPYPPAYPAAYMPYPAGIVGPVRPIVVPIDYVYRTNGPPPPPQQAVWNLPEPRRQFYSPEPQRDDWEFSRLAATSMPAQSRVTEPMQSTAPAIIARRLDRIQLTM